MKEERKKSKNGNARNKGNEKTRKILIILQISSPRSNSCFPLLIGLEPLPLAYSFTPVGLIAYATDAYCLRLLPFLKFLVSGCLNRFIFVYGML